MNNKNLKVVFFLALFISSFIPLNYVIAGGGGCSHDWSGTSINSDYAITTDWHGEEAPVGTEVTAIAGTTNPDIVKVRFRWIRPDGTIAREVYVEIVDHIDTWNGENVYVFIDTFIVDQVGDWGVQAIFYDSTGTGHGPFEDKEAIRATSINVIPEAPLGTITILIAMLGALSIFAIKKKVRPLIRLPLPS